MTDRLSCESRPYDLSIADDGPVGATGTENDDGPDAISLTAIAIWIAGKVIGGVFAQIGSGIFSRAFPSDSNGGGLVARLAMQDILLINRLTRDAIADNAIRQCAARIDGVSSLMRQYDTSPSSSLDRLTSATAEIVQATSEIKSLGFRGAKIHWLATYTQIAVLQERQIRFSDPSEHRNIISLSEDSLKHQYGTCNEGFAAWLNSRFAGGFRPDENGISISLDGMYYYFFDGEPHGFPRRRDALDAKEKRYYDELRTSADVFFGPERNELLARLIAISKS